MSLKSLNMLQKEPNLKKILWFIVITSIALLAILSFIPWQQTVEGHGNITTLSPSEREQGISAPIGGRLGNWYVFEGDHVNKGDPIVEVLDLDPEVVIRLEEEKAAIELGISSYKIAVKNANKISKDMLIW